MSKKDFYEILGINKSANSADIKSAYRKLAKEYHPDVYKGDKKEAEIKFKELQEAYSVLSDDTKKRQYDQFGHAAFDQMNQGGGYGGYQGGFSGFDDIDLGDIFGSMFGSGFSSSFNGRGANSRQRGNDSLVKMTLSFEEAVFGCEKDITLTINDECEDCNGKGGHDEKTCSECRGSGTVASEQKTIFGSFVTKTSCPTCHGKGKSYNRVCSKCHGKGSYDNKKTLSIKIPSGVDNEQRLRLSGKGNAGVNGGGNGDLYIEFIVKEHEFYVRENNNIYLEIPVSITDAILGCKKEIPTIHGNVTLSIPAGSKTGDKHRLKGKGINNQSNGHKGDMYAIIDVQIPDKLSKEQKKIIEQLSKTDLENNQINKFNGFINKNK